MNDQAASPNYRPSDIAANTVWREIVTESGQPTDQPARMVVVERVGPTWGLAPGQLEVREVGKPVGEVVVEPVLGWLTRWSIVGETTITPEGDMHFRPSTEEQSLAQAVTQPTADAPSNLVPFRPTKAHKKLLGRRVMYERTKGLSLDAIAANLGIPTEQVDKLLARELERLPSPHADDYRKLETARYEEMVAAWWDRAVAGDPKAADIVATYLGKIDRLNGLNMPERHEVGGKIDHQVSFTDKVLDRLSAMGDRLRDIPTIPNPDWVEGEVVDEVAELPASPPTDA